MRGFWCAVAVVSALACGCVREEREADWFGDQRFSAVERREIERGAAWLYEQGGLEPPRIVWTYRVTSGEPLPRTIRREVGPGRETGFCTDSGAIYLDPTPTPEHPTYLAGLAAHEMAHCVLGLADDPQSEGIMHDLDPLAWTAREAAQCERCVTGTEGR